MNNILPLPERFEVMIAKLVVRHFITSYAVSSYDQIDEKEMYLMTRVELLDDFYQYVEFANPVNAYGRVYGQAAIDRAIQYALTETREVNSSTFLLDLDNPGIYKDLVHYPFVVYAEWIAENSCLSVIDTIHRFFTLIRDEIDREIELESK